MVGLVVGEFFLFAAETLVYVVPAGILLVFLGLGYAARCIVDHRLRLGASRTEQRFDDIVFRACRGVLILWSALIGAAAALRATAVPLPEIVYANSDKVIVSLLILSAAFCFGRILSGLIHSYGHRIEALAALSGIGERIGQLVIMAIGIMMALQYLNIDITPLVTTLGIAGLATALALQDTLANFFAGFYILADRPIRIGDYIRVGSGEEGYVVEVGWRSTKMRTLSNNIVVIPNQKLAQSVITNFCSPEKRTSVSVAVGVSYDCDPDYVERVLVEVATSAVGEVDGLLGDPPPAARLIPGFGESSLNFTLNCQIREFVDQFYVQHELRKRILVRFRQEGIDIPFPVRTVHFPTNGQAGRSPQSPVRQMEGFQVGLESADGGGQQP